MPAGRAVKPARARVVPRRLGSVPYSAAKTRTITTALALFAEHGVGGTSLQMIADAIGVTKAAVYHQFKTKEEIVLAAAELELVKLQAALDSAEAEAGRPRALDALLTKVIDLTVEGRRMVSALHGDPVMVRLLAKHEPFRQLMDRLYCLLTGDRPGTEARVRAALLSAAIRGVVIHPLVMDLDDDTLRSELQRVARRLVHLPD